MLNLDRPIKNVKFDLDGVLINLMAVTKHLLNRDGFEIQLPRTGFRISTIPELSGNQIWKYFYQAYDLWRITPIFDGANELTKALYHHTGKPIEIITARPINFATETYRTIDRFMEVPYTVAIVPGTDKHAFLGPDDMIVEDRRKTVVDLANIGVRSFLIDKDYNQIENPPVGIYRVSGLPEIMDALPRIFER